MFAASVQSGQAGQSAVTNATPGSIDLATLHGVMTKLSIDLHASYTVMMFSLD